MADALEHGRHGCPTLDRALGLVTGVSEIIHRALLGNDTEAALCRDRSGGRVNLLDRRKTMIVSVILPTYNERDNIGELIECIDIALRAESFAYECLVVDDNSPDGTAQFVREQFGNRENIRVCVRLHERGLASAIKHGVLNAAGDVVVVMDTDFNHDPRMIPQMVKFLQYYDIVIGSRFVMRGGMRERGRGS